jgi:hypothetical protein
MTISTTDGFRVLDLDTHTLSKNNLVSGGLAHSYQQKKDGTSLIIGTGLNQERPSNKVFVWDHKTSKIIGEIKPSSDPVLSSSLFG